MLNSKRGTITEVAYLIVAFLVISIFFIFVSKIVTEIDNSNFVTESDTQEEQNAMEEWTRGLSSARLDKFFLGIVLGSFIAMIILSVALRTSIIFWIIGFFILVIDIILSAIASNVYEQFYAHSSITAISTQFTLQNHIMLNLPIYVTIIGFILMAVLYGFSTYLEG